MTKIIEFVSGAAVAAVLIWLFGSCFEIAFNGFAGDLNAIRLLLTLA
jgi:hypothetical protein